LFGFLKIINVWIVNFHKVMIHQYKQLRFIANLTSSLFAIALNIN